MITSFPVTESDLVTFARRVVNLPLRNTGNLGFIPVPQGETGLVTYKPDVEPLRHEPAFKYFGRSQLRAITWVSASGKERLTAIKSASGQWRMRYSGPATLEDPIYTLLAKILPSLKPG